MADTKYNSDYNDTSEKSSKIRHIDTFLEDFDNFDEYDYNDGVSRKRTSSRSTSASKNTSSARKSSGKSASSGNSQASRSSSSRSSSAAARTAKSSSGRSKSSSIKKKKKKFKKLLLGYIAVLIVILIVLAIVLSIALKNYENGQSFHAAEAIVKNYSSQQSIIDFVTANADKASILDNAENVAEVYATNIAGKDISYIESPTSRQEAPSYYITADGSTVAQVTFSRASGSNKWEISELDISDYLPDTMTVSIEVPQGSEVTLNGNVLDTSCIVSTAIPDVLADSVDYIDNPPMYDTYKLSGLLSDPDISVKDQSGNSLKVTKTDSAFIAGLVMDQDYLDTIEDRVYEALYNYATYFIHMSSSLYNYIVYGTEIYSYIFGSDTMDPIDTNLYNWEYIDHYDFAKESVDNIIFYTEDCFTADIEYALDMYFTDPTFEDNNQNMKATWVFAIEPLDGSWCISAITSR